jgi:hypothetical protein
MRTKRVVMCIAWTVCALSIVAASVPALAAASDVQRPATLSQRDAELLRIFSPDEIQAFRGQLVMFLQDINRLREMTGHPADKAESDLFSARLANLKDVDIARWLAAGANLAPARRALDSALASAAAAKVHARDRVREPATTPDFPMADYGTKCLEIQTNTDIVFIAKTAVNAAKLLWIPAKNLCDEVVVIAGEGGNGSSLCDVTDEALEMLKILYEEYYICDNGDSAAEADANYKRLAYLNEQIDTDYKAIVSNENANTAATIQAMTTLSQNSQTSLLRLMIEQNLSSGGPKVISFELPEVLGGNLESVRDLVTHLIASLQASGQNVGNAPFYLNRGNELFAEGQYKLAYAKYRWAYLVAAKSSL